MIDKISILTPLISTLLIVGTVARAQECDVDAQLGLDRDDDGIPDIVELYLGSDPEVADSDGDGIVDGLEINVLGTSPRNPDSDGDGLCDGGRDVDGSCRAGEDMNEDGVVDRTMSETDPVCTLDEGGTRSLHPTISGTSVFTCAGSTDPLAYGVLFSPVFVLASRTKGRRRCQRRSPAARR